MPFATGIINAVYMPPATAAINAEYMPAGRVLLATGVINAVYITSAMFLSQPLVYCMGKLRGECGCGCGCRG